MTRAPALRVSYMVRQIVGWCLRDRASCYADAGEAQQIVIVCKCRETGDRMERMERKVCLAAGKVTVCRPLFATRYTSRWTIRMGEEHYTAIGRSCFNSVNHERVVHELFVLTKHSRVTASQEYEDR